MNMKRKILITLSTIFLSLIFFLVLGFIDNKNIFSVAKNSFQTSPPSNNSSNIISNPFIKNPHQITFVGPRAGEGYFSADGEELIFQSERFEQNPFYQIYLMNLKTGKTTLISTGKGQTTCSWLSPHKDKALFSSTHLDPNNEVKVKNELETRKQSAHKYSWSFDDNYDIFVKDLKTQKFTRLTTELGYDAEGSFSPDGKQIVFASNRKGYSEKLSDEDQKIFTQDQSYMMDIYIMNADGTNVRQLTTAKGYDGGPFFSADGKKITWRRFTPDGRSAEVNVMNIDGSNQMPVTQLKSMSWAPYFHPSGKYIIFTTNLHGYSNFELYIVDAEGKHEPVRVTNEDGFDGLPVFSPNGNQLSWTKKNAKGESQIYLADWNHESALKALDIQEPVKLNVSDLSSNITSDDLKKNIFYLASKTFQGRATGSDEELIYTKKFAELYKAWGFKPAPLAVNFINEFEFLADVKLGSNNELIINNKPYTIGTDWNPVSFSQSGDTSKGSLVFAGYGMFAPATEKFPEYNSYKGLEVKDKWVMVFRDIPNDIEGEFRYHLNFYSRIQHKVTVAKNLGAKGLILISGPRSAYKQKLPKFQFEGGLSDTSMAVLNLNDPVVDKLLTDSGYSTLEALQKKLDDGSFQEGLDLSKVTVQAKIDITPLRKHGHNAIAYLSVPNAKETIVIGAHGDHLGLGLPGVSLATSDMKDRIHYGADDNASGVSAVLELAHYFSKNRGQLKTNLIFAIWSGEELGNLGSKNYLDQLKKSKLHNLKFKAYINLDMVGRLKENLYTQGLGSSLEWRTIIEGLSLNTPFSIVPQDDPYLPTDAMSFYVESKIPVISLFTGSHMEYHTPLDTPEKINFDGLVKVTDFTKNLITKVSGINSLPFKEIESSNNKNLEGRKFKIYLGTIPDYAQDGVKGVKISGTSKNSPAEKAGLIANDIILQLAEQKIENLYDFTFALQVIKPNKETTIKVQRDDKVVELKITPGIKE